MTTDAQGDTSGAGRWSFGLIALLGLVLMPRDADLFVATILNASVAKTASHSLFVWMTLGVQAVAIVVAGFAFDRFGARAVIGWGLPLWGAALIATGAAADPLIALVLHQVALFVLMFAAVGAPLVIKLAWRAGRRARVFAVLNIVATIWFFAVPYVAKLVHWPPTPEWSAGWAWGFVVMGLSGPLIALLWWPIVSRRDNPNARRLGRRASATVGFFGEVRDLFRRKMVWALLVSMVCHTQLFFTLQRLLVLSFDRDRLMPSALVVRTVELPLAVFVVSLLVFAIWSDRRFALTGHVASARSPFVVVGAGLSTVVGLLPAVGTGTLVPLLCGIAVAVALYATLYPLVLDLVPRQVIGRFFGIATAATVLSLSASFVIAPILTALFGGRRGSLDAYFYLAGLASFVGAVLAVRQLRSVEPLDDAPDGIEAIKAVFS